LALAFRETAAIHTTKNGGWENGGEIHYYVKHGYSSVALENEIFCSPKYGHIVGKS
jgi:hypothetical protein